MIKTLPFLLLCFLTLLSITSELYTGDPYNLKRFIQVALITLSTLLLAGTISIEKKWKILASTALFIGIISVLQSNNLLNSLLNFIHTYLLFNLILLGIYIKEKVNYLFYALFFSNLFLVCCSLLNYNFFLLDGELPNADGILYGFNNIRFFNQFQIVCIPIVIYFLNNKNLSRVAAILLTLNILLFFISGARGATLALFIGLIISFYYQLLSKQILFKIFGCSIAAALLFYMYISYHSDIITLAYTFRTSSSGRVAIWSDLISKLTFVNIFIGHGPGAYVSNEFRLSHPHNSVLQIVYNWGLIITLLVFSALLLLIKRSILQCIINKNQHNNTCVLVVISLLTYSLVSGIIVMPMSQTFIFIFIGLLISFSDLKVSFQKRTKKHLVSVTVLAIIYVCTVALSYNCVTSAVFGPGFWSNGQFSFSECRIPFKEK